MFNLEVTINDPSGAENEFEVEDGPFKLSDLKDEIADIISDNPQASSFVFVVARLP